MNEGFETKTFHTTFIIRKKRLQKIGINDNKTHPASLKYKYSGKDGLIASDPMEHSNGKFSYMVKINRNEIEFDENELNKN